MSFTTVKLLDSVEYGFCAAPDCDPFDPQGGADGFHACQPGVGCGFIHGQATRCKEPGPNGLRDTCANSYDCDDGLACVLFEDASGNVEGTCLGSCRPALNGTSDCTEANTVCYSYAGGTSLINGVEFGYCGDL
jgi:hypothetical protein